MSFQNPTRASVNRNSCARKENDVAGRSHEKVRWKRDAAALSIKTSLVAPTNIVCVDAERTKSPDNRGGGT